MASRKQPLPGRDAASAETGVRPPVGAPADVGSPDRPANGFQPTVNMDESRRSDLLALAVAGANDGLWDWDAATNRVYRSRRVQEILGMPPADLNSTRDAWLAIIHPDDVTRYKAAVRALFTNMSSHFECEYRVRHADGSYRWLLDRALALRDAQCRVQRMAGSVSDITERKAMEEALRGSEQRFRDYAETASDWYWETDSEHRFIDAWVLLPPRSIGPERRIGRRRWEFAADVETEPEKWNDHIAALDRREFFRNFVYAVELSDESFQFVSVSGKPVFNGDGNFTGYRGSARDVTDAMLSAQALYCASQEARAANTAKSGFLANMSHELRTPLNAILGFSKVISREMLGPVSNGRYREYAEDILRSGRHLLELISDILDMSKIEAGKLDLHERVIDVGAIVLACLPLVRQRASEAEIALIVDIPSDLPWLNADETRLKQILLNLLTNAVKFTPQGGRVTISARQEHDGSLCVAVDDTGIGMSQEGIALALEPFHQIENAAAKSVEGTGLGLPLTKRLIELHGGTIDIDSMLNRGTVVTVYFPASRVVSGLNEESRA